MSSKKTVYFHRLGNGRLRRPVVSALILVSAAALGLILNGSPRSAPRLLNGLDSPEAVAEQILTALATGDREELAGLALSEDEFRRFVWPELPVSNPRTNVPFNFVWDDVHFRSTNHLNRLLKNLQGRKLALAGLKIRGKITEYATHRAYPDYEIKVRKEDGEVVSLPLFGTLIEMDGRYKVYSYAPFD